MLKSGVHYLRTNRRCVGDRDDSLAWQKEIRTAKGQVHGVGVGPEDPELITLKAVHVIQECPVILRCGMEGERSYPSLESIPDDASYLTLVIACHR